MAFPQMSATDHMMRLINGAEDELDDVPGWFAETDVGSPSIRAMNRSICHAMDHAYAAHMSSESTLRGRPKLTAVVMACRH